MLRDLTTSLRKSKPPLPVKLIALYGLLFGYGFSIGLIVLLVLVIDKLVEAGALPASWLTFFGLTGTMELPTDPIVLSIGGLVLLILIGITIFTSYQLWLMNIRGFWWAAVFFGITAAFYIIDFLIAPSVARSALSWVVLGVDLAAVFYLLTHKKDFQPLPAGRSPLFGILSVVFATIFLSVILGGIVVSKTVEKSITDKAAQVATGSSLTVDSANIRVLEPYPSQEISSPVTLRGQARVFENVVSYRIKDSNGKVLASGTTTADSPDVGRFGPFTVSVSFIQPETKGGSVEVFQASAKDGSDTDKVTIQVTFK